MNDEIDWVEIGAALRAPFAPEDVDFRPQGKPSGNGKVQAVCYIDARTVADRLDEVVGPGAWSFHYEPLLVERGEIQLAKGTLTIHGVTKEDVGDGSTFATSKGCVSDALKRAAVLFGVGRYLYGVGGEWVTADQYGRISEADVQRLRAKLPGGKAVVAPAPQTFVTAPKSLAPAVNPSDAKELRREPKLETLADVQQALANYRNVLGITDKTIIATDMKLDYQASLARRSDYVEAWKRASMDRQKAGVTR